MWATWCGCLTWTQGVKISSGKKTWDLLEITYTVMIKLCVELRMVEAFWWVWEGVRNKDSEVGIEATCICFLSVAVLTHRDQKQLKTERIYFSLQFQWDQVRPGWCHYDGVSGVGSRVITCHMYMGNGRGCKPSDHAPRDRLPPTRLCLLNNLSKPCHKPRDQVCGTVLIQTTPLSLLT